VRRDRGRRRTQVGEKVRVICAEAALITGLIQLQLISGIGIQRLIRRCRSFHSEAT